jgi:hypothetical protein
VDLLLIQRLDDEEVGVPQLLLRRECGRIRRDPRVGIDLSDSGSAGTRRKCKEQRKKGEAKK